MYKNICKKYNIDEKEFKETIERVYYDSQIGSWCCDIDLMIAITDFICNADIPAEE